MPTDEELMIAYCAGDARAFRQLFERYAPPLRRALLRRVGSEEVACDLVQQTFLQLHRARNDYIAGAPLRPWLFTIALNLSRERIRQRRRRPEVLVPEPAEASAATNVADAARFEAARDVHRALAELPEAQREVIVMHWEDGLSFAEVGAVLGLSEGAVRARAHRAYLTLRARLAHNETPSPGISEEE